MHLDTTPGVDVEPIALPLTLRDGVRWPRQRQTPSIRRSRWSRFGENDNSGVLNGRRFGYLLVTGQTTTWCGPWGIGGQK